MNGNGCSPLLPGTRQNLRSAVRVWELMRRQTVKAFTVSDTDWDSMPITGDDFAEIGPATTDLFVHLEMRNQTGTFECAIVIQRKYLDGDWEPAVGDLAAGDFVLGSSSTPVDADGYVSNLFVDRSRTGALQIRLLLLYRAATGGATGNQADLSISVVSNPLCC